MVRDTSLEAYKDLLDNDLINLSQGKVLSALISFKGFPTDKELSEFSGIPINVVTPRRGELEGLGLVENIGKKVCSVTGRKAHHWKVSESYDFESVKSKKISSKVVRKKCVFCQGKGYL